MNGTLSSNNNTERELEVLNRQISHIFQKLSEIERSERQVLGEKKEAIVYLAQLFERQHELGAYTEPIDTICAHICKLGRDKYHLLASERWIHEVLGEVLDENGKKKYLQTKFDPTVNKIQPLYDDGLMPIEKALDILRIENSLEQPELATNLTDDYDIKRITQKSLDELRDPKEISIATTEEIRKADRLKSMARETAKRAELLKERCARLNIQYQDTENEESISDVDTIPVVSAISENSGPGLFSNKLLEYGGEIIRAGRKVEKYKPDPVMDAKYAECIDKMIKVWRGWVDEKYRKDTISWLHVAMDKQAHGKHAAATMHATILPDGTKRALTREQVGDKDELVLQQAMNVLLMQDDIAAMHSWYVNYPEKAIARRAKKLHGRLSNSA